MNELALAIILSKSKMGLQMIGNFDALVISLFAFVVTATLVIWLFRQMGGGKI